MVWGTYRTAICTGWGLAPFTYNKNRIHPELLFAPPYGTIPYRGGRDFNNLMIGGYVHTPWYKQMRERLDKKRSGGWKFGHLAGEYVNSPWYQEMLREKERKNGNTLSLLQRLEKKRDLMKKKWDAQQIASETTFF